MYNTHPEHELATFHANQRLLHRDTALETQVRRSREPRPRWTARVASFVSRRVRRLRARTAWMDLIRRKARAPGLTTRPSTNQFVGTDSESARTADDEMIGERA